MSLRAFDAATDDDDARVPRLIDRSTRVNLERARTPHATVHRAARAIAHLSAHLVRRASSFHHSFHHSIVLAPSMMIFIAYMWGPLARRALLSDVGVPYI